ncbi:hypothetical protein PC2016_3394 [Pseudoalteromonas carrageenovora]|uniref:DUF1761 domain-containing protein n=2 Tax=Pseudoalteromonas carrageenovora TaxID=227 RepID=A0A2K4XF84_PSEVC|nr:hypothetical protein [Pseudoalteromonas carrageenovora IAM 12662]QBJ73569.1 hypothetical protein PC2016_3394 [Pseudoalteromonas carrageenovora]SOU42980.1 conserved membrane protein of unknown function [Pseudoalteromonas carrageenovora IAM 12662]
MAVCMNFTEVNYFAILVASLSSFMLRGVWYSKVLFKNAWLESIGLTDLDLQSADPKLIFVGSFLLAFIAALVLALFLGKEAGIGESLGTSFAIGLFWVCSSLGLSYIFEQRPLKLFLINGSYHVLQFSLMGLILGLWP